MALCTNQMNFGCKCMMILIFLASSSKCSNKQGDFYNHHHRHLDLHPSSYQQSYKVEQCNDETQEGISSSVLIRVLSN